MVQWRTMYPLFWNSFVTECTIKLCKLNFCISFSGTFKFSLPTVHSVSYGPGNKKTWPKVIKLYSYSTQLSTKFILLINVKMPTIVGILTFISMIRTASERLKARNFFICRYFSVFKQLKFSAQLS